MVKGEQVKQSYGNFPKALIKRKWMRNEREEKSSLVNALTNRGRSMEEFINNGRNTLYWVQMFQILMGSQQYREWTWA